MNSRLDTIAEAMVVTELVTDYRKERNCVYKSISYLNVCMLGKFFESGKVMKLSSGNNDITKQDFISKLPDTLLTYIISLLPKADACRTSILSNRWKDLWMFLPNLHFVIPNSSTREQASGHNIRALKSGFVLLLSVKFKYLCLVFGFLLAFNEVHEIDELDELNGLNVPIFPSLVKLVIDMHDILNLGFCLAKMHGVSSTDNLEILTINGHELDPMRLERVAAIMTHAFEGDVYFRLRVDLSFTNVGLSLCGAGFKRRGLVPKGRKPWLLPKKKSIPKDVQGRECQRSREYHARVHARSKLHYFLLMKDRLSLDRCELFRSTCFGRWLDLTYVENDEGIIHYMLQMQKFSDNDHYDFPLIYNVNGHMLHFGHREFCLITGFKFGLLSFRKFKKGDICFHDRVSTDKVGEYVKNIDLLSMNEDEDHFTKLSEEELQPRVCLLLFSDVIFHGSVWYGSAVDDVFHKMVDNLEVLSDFLWGEHIWRELYAAIRNVNSKHKDEHHKALEKKP
ncbi:phospholipase-like, aminotransferase-like mobile domain protein [Tanacetum coccineum]